MEKKRSTKNVVIGIILFLLAIPFIRFWLFSLPTLEGFKTAPERVLVGQLFSLPFLLIGLFIFYKGYQRLKKR